jgi:hypothetical protein
MTRSMTRWTMAGALALAALGSVAVFGVASATARADPSVSPFAGSWSGPWDIAAIPDHFGVFEWTIADDGRITGTVNGVGTIKGHVREDGTLTFIGYVDPDTLGAYPFKGTAVIDDDGTLAISATGMFNGNPNNKVEDWLLASLERK